MRLLATEYLKTAAVGLPGQPQIAAPRSSYFPALLGAGVGTMLGSALMGTHTSGAPPVHSLGQEYVDLPDPYAGEEPLPAPEALGLEAGDRVIRELPEDTGGHLYQAPRQTTL